MLDVDRYLEKLDTLVDVHAVAEAQRRQELAWAYEPVDRLPIFVGLRNNISKTRYGRSDWPVFIYEEIFESREKMLLSELEPLYESALIGDDKLFVLRANYGVGIIPSIFGCEIKVEGDDFPWVVPLEFEQAKKIAKAGLPPLRSELLDRVIETEAYFAEKIAPYEHLSKVVHVSVCDVQGPMNLLAEIIGERVYTDLIDHPDVLHDLLNVFTEAYIAVSKAQKDVIGEALDSSYYFHHYRMQHGGARITEDYGLSISKAMYEEFCKPYNERCFAPFGGGYMLYCGTGLQVLDTMLDTKGLRALQVWSDDPDDLKMVYEKAARRKVCVLWDTEKPLSDAEFAIETGAVLRHTVGSIEEAKRLVEEYRNSKF